MLEKDLRRDDLLVSDLVAKYEAEDSGQQDAYCGLDHIQHIHKRGYPSDSLRIHSCHVFQTDGKGLCIFKYVYVFSKYPSKKENSKDVGNYHLGHAFTISEEDV